MTGKEYSLFKHANEYVLNKDVVINNYIKYMLSRTQSMFAYENLPETIPASKLELILQTKGYAFITDVEGSLYALHGTLTGMPDVYEDCTEINIANVALNLTKTYNLANDGVLINNDVMQLGLLPILNKYGALLAENTISIHTIDVILRMVCTISASDDRTYTSALKYIEDVENGKISAIGESAFFDGIKVHSIANTQNYLTQFIEMEQYLKASCFNEIGLNANYNMKKESINSQESAMNDDFLLPLVDNMIKERQTAIDKINDKYGLNITIDFASAWKITHEENQKQIAISESIQEQMGNAESMDLTLDEQQGNPNPDRALIKIEGRDENVTSVDTGTETESPETDNTESPDESQNTETQVDTGTDESDETANNSKSETEIEDDEAGTDDKSESDNESDVESPNSDTSESDNNTDKEIDVEETDVEVTEKPANEEKEDEDDERKQN